MVVRRRISVRLGALVALVAVAASLLAPTPVGAAGVTTHGWMAVEAIDRIDDPELAALLRAHEHQVRAGAMFPDAGYVSPNTFGEEAHWQRFVDAYVDQLLLRDDCGDLADPDGPCADMVAHIMGVAGHGMGDEVWDWLFEPYSPDLDEYYVSPGLATSNEGGAEIQMDVVAIGVHGVPRPQIPDLPDIDTLIAAFDAAGFEGVTASQFALAGLGEAVWDYESQSVAAHLGPIQAAMPWMSANLVTAPGGIEFAATAIAGYWESLWGRMNGAQPTTRVSITHPAPGQDDLPATGWERSFQAGSSRSGGGARNRIVAVLTHARPYVPPGGGPHTVQMEPGTMTITRLDTGAPVPLMAGYPRSVPYNGEAGHHLIDVQPAADLPGCTWFEVAVGVTTPVLDARGVPVTPHTWQFRTECAEPTLGGRVTDPGGDPVEGALVLAYRTSDGFVATAAAGTTADGSYTLNDLPDGEYALHVVPPPGSDLARAWSGPAATRAGATRYALPAAEPQPPVDLALTAAAAVAGRVTGPGGEAAPGVEVFAFAATDTWVPTGRAVTGDDGNYQIEGLPSGPYLLAFRAPDTTALGWFDGAAARSTATPVPVGAVPQTGIDHQLTS